MDRKKLYIASRSGGRRIEMVLIFRRESSPTLLESGFKRQKKENVLDG